MVQRKLVTSFISLLLCPLVNGGVSESFRGESQYAEDTAKYKAYAALDAAGGRANQGLEHAKVLVHEGASIAYEKLHDGLESLKETLHIGFEEAKDRASDGLHAAMSVASDQSDEVAEQLSSAAESSRIKLEDHVNQRKAQLTGKTRYAEDTAEYKAYHLFDEGRDRANTYYGIAKDGIIRMAQEQAGAVEDADRLGLKVADTLTKVQAKGQETWDTVKGKVQDGLEVASESANEVVGSTWQLGGETVGEASDSVRKGYEAVKQLSAKGVGEAPVSRHVKSTGREEINEAYDGASNFVQEITDHSDRAASRTRSRSVEAGDSALDEGKRRANNAIEEMKHFGSEGTDAAKEIASDLVHKSGARVNKLKENVDEVAQATVTGGKEAYAGVKDVLKRGADMALNAADAGFTDRKGSSVPSSKDEAETSTPNGKDGTGKWRDTVEEKRRAFYELSKERRDKFYSGSGHEDFEDRPNHDGGRTPRGVPDDSVQDERQTEETANTWIKMRLPFGWKYALAALVCLWLVSKLYEISRSNERQHAVQLDMPLLGTERGVSSDGRALHGRIIHDPRKAQHDALKQEYQKYLSKQEHGNEPRETYSAPGFFQSRN